MDNKWNCYISSNSVSVEVNKSFMGCFVSFGRLWCPQHDLQCVSCSVAQLQQPVWWWIWHRVQTETLHSLHLLFFGSIILEKVPVSPCILTDIEGIENRWFIGSFFLFTIQAKGVLRDCLQGSLWRGDYWPSALQALLQFQETNAGNHTSGHTPPRYASSAAPGRRERKLVIAFIEPPCRVIHGIRLTLSPVADLHVSIPPMKC